MVTKKRRGEHIELGLGVDKPTVKQNGVGRLAEMIGYPDDKTRKHLLVCLLPCPSHNID